MSAHPLSEFDAVFGASPRPAAPVSPTRAAGGGAAGGIPNGFFTLTFPDGSHRTFRVFTKRRAAKFAPGRRLMAMLIGPDNASDYESFAFVNDDGVDVWKRFRGQKQEEYAGLVWLLATGCEAEGHELLVSKRCLVCNRTLTDPESVELGIGPQCRQGRADG